jgi:hypothetical protein
MEKDMAKFLYLIIDPLLKLPALGLGIVGLKIR